jgi:penicillin-binding protein 1A
MLGDKVNPSQRVRRGAIIRVQKDEKDRWQITQLPEVESSFVAMDPRDGAIRALVGGFDFYRNQYNHVTQALRQPGSSFKPFIYSAALEKGFTPATVINDAPLTFTAAQTGSEPWEPKNYDGKFEGPMRLRTALAKSKNLISVRVLQAISPQYAQDYVTRFGFDPKMHPPYLTMALGAGNVTPMQMTAAYAIFANGGYRVTPYFIERVEDARGNVLVAAKPVAAGAGAERVIDARNAFLMTSIMRDVVRAGTAARAMRLGRHDLAGKTGTTNEFVDAWFCGFNAELVAVSWIGFDTPQTLGRNETGSQAALPIWMGYMGAVLKGAPEQQLSPPNGVVAVRVNPETGLRVADAQAGVVDYFYQEFLPPEHETLVGGVMGGDRPREEVRNQLF